MSLVLTIILASAWCVQPEAAAVGEAESAGVEASVGEATLAAITGRRATLELRGRAKPFEGKALAYRDGFVVLEMDGGQVVEVARSTIVAVTLHPEPSVAAPLRAPTCRDDDACDRPRRCVLGECRVDQAYVEALEVEGHLRRSGAKKTMIAGGTIALVGAVMLTVGLVGDYGTGPERYPRDKDWARGTWGAGTALLVGGAITTVVGAIFHRIGSSKLRRVEQYRRELELELHGAISRTGHTFGLRGQF